MSEGVLRVEASAKVRGERFVRLLGMVLRKCCTGWRKALSGDGSAFCMSADAGRWREFTPGRTGQRFLVFVVPSVLVIHYLITRQKTGILRRLLAILLVVGYLAVFASFLGLSPLRTQLTVVVMSGTVLVLSWALARDKPCHADRLSAGRSPVAIE